MIFYLRTEEILCPKKASDFPQLFSGGGGEWGRIIPQNYLRCGVFRSFQTLRWHLLVLKLNFSVLKLQKKSKQPFVNSKMCCENVTLFENDSRMKFTLSIVPQPNHLQLQITSPLGLEYTNLWCPWTLHSRLDDVSRTACLDSNTKGPRLM